MRFDQTGRVGVCGIGAGSGVSGDRGRTSFETSGSDTDGSFVLPTKIGVV